MKDDVVQVQKENFFKKLFSSKQAKSFRNSLISIVFGVFVGFLILVISNPKNSLSGLARLLFNPFISAKPLPTSFGEVFSRATPIILTGLSVAFAFKTGVFNIGASGQYMVGLFGAAVVGLYGDNLGFLQWPLAVLVGGLSGAVWGAISGSLKAFFNVNVVITGIMLNYIAVYFINGMLGGPLRQVMLNSTNNRTNKIPEAARTPYMLLDKIFPRSGVDLSFIMAIVIAIVVALILSKTVFGRELKSVGLNKDAAKYAGVNEKYSIIISMAISGFFAGLAGAFYILSPGAYGMGAQYSRENVVLPDGFNGIPVALLASSNPIGVIFSGFFISYIQHSGLALQSLGYANELVDVVVGVILYFSAFSLIMGQYAEKLIKRRKKEKETEEIKIL